jgi:fucose 4-O-acetylase-like acetyltransferase
MNAGAADKVDKVDKRSWVAKAFNTSILQKSRLAWVDYLKGIAILLVVYRHVLIGIQLSGITIPATLVNANMVFYSFRMPLFFILSGIFIGGSLARRTTGQLIFTKFENLLYPYLVWSFIQVTLQIALRGSTNADRGFIDYTYILYQPRNMDQLWYLPALFNTTVIYLLVKTKLKPPGWAQLLFGLMLFFTAHYVDRISMLSDWMEFYFFFALGDNMAAFFFKNSTQRLLKNPWSLVAITPLFILTQFFYLSQDQNFYLANNLGLLEFMAIALIGCLCMCILAFRLQEWNTLRFLRVLGYHSLYIYVMHVVVASAARLLLKNMLHIHNPVVLLAAGIALGVTVPVICYNLFIFEKPGWFLFTLKKRKSRPAGTKPAPSASFAS